MKPNKFITSLFLVTAVILALSNIGFIIAGYQTDPTGDADGINGCDITRVDVLVSYHSPPTDDDVTLKITLLEAPLLDENHTIRYDYNFFVDTSLSATPDTTTWSDDVYEYRAHLTCRWSSNTWVNESWLFATRYYYTGDGQGKTMGSYYWNPNTDTWGASDPGLEVGQVIGNTVQWDVTHAIFREQPIGTGYVIQGVANAAYGLVVKDYAPNSGWCDEFDNVCPTPPTTTGTPSIPLPGFGFLISFIAMGLIAGSVFIIKRRK